MDFAFLSSTFLLLLSGLPMTLSLAGSSVVIGTALGAVITLMRVSSIRPLASFANGYVFVFRGTPLLIQIFMIYYGLGQFRPQLQAIGLWTFFREPYYCAVLALALNTGAYCSEIMRGGLLAVPGGAIESAIACGMGRFHRFRRIVFPLALRQALPGYGNELILMVKATSLASIITLMEVTGLAGKLIAETYRAIEIFACAGAIYLIINFILTRILVLLEWWLSIDRRILSQMRRTRVPAVGATR